MKLFDSADKILWNISLKLFDTVDKILSNISLKHFDLADKILWKISLKLFDSVDKIRWNISVKLFDSVDKIPWEISMRIYDLLAFVKIDLLAKSTNLDLSRNFLYIHYFTFSIKLITFSKKKKSMKMFSSYDRNKIN